VGLRTDTHAVVLFPTQSGRRCSRFDERPSSLRQLGSQVRFGSNAARSRPAEYDIERGPDDRRAIEERTRLGNTAAEIIELRDLPIEQNDRNLRPFFLENAGTTGFSLAAAGIRADPGRGHAADYIGFLIVQTQPLLQGRTRHRSSAEHAQAVWSAARRHAPW
jgi:hypothetical protein